MVHIVQNISGSAVSLLGESVAEACYCILPDAFLDMKVVPSHVQICMAHDTLDGFHGNAKRLKLRNVGMPAAMWRQHADIIHLLQRCLELRCKVRGITRMVRNLGRIPDILLLRFPQCPGAIAYHGRYRNGPITVVALRSANSNASFDSHKSLFNGNGSSVFGDVSGFQSQKFLGSHTRCKQQPDTPTDFIFRKVLHQVADFISRESFLTFGRSLAHLLGILHRILHQIVISHCFFENLKKHSATLGKCGIGTSFFAQLSKKLFNVHGFDIRFSMTQIDLCLFRCATSFQGNNAIILQKST